MVDRREPAPNSTAGRPVLRRVAAGGIVVLAAAFAGGLWLTRRDVAPAVFGHYGRTWFAVAVAATLATVLVAGLLIRAILRPASPPAGRAGLPLWKRLVFVLIVVSVPLAGAELWLRHQIRSAFEKAAYPDRLDYAESFHSLLQITSREEVDGRWVRTYRGRTVSREKSADFRIVCLGGSTTLGSDMPLERTWPFRLEEHLREAGLDVEVINAGLPWYTAAHSLTNYVIQMRYFDPDVVIVMHAVNDLHRSFTDLEGSSPEWDYGSSLGPMRDVFRGWARRAGAERRPPMPTCAIWAVFCEATRADELYYSALRSDDETSRDALARNQARRRVAGERSLPFGDLFSREPADSQHPGLDAGLEVYVSIAPLKAHLDCLTKVAQADGARVVLSTQAHVYSRPEADGSDGPAQGMRLAFFRPDGVHPVSPGSLRRAMAAVREAVFDVAERRGATVADAEAAVNGDPTCFLDDFHLSDEGNRRVAEEMARTVEPLLRSLAPPRASGSER